MATYVSLLQFTDQGIRTVKDTTKRAEAAQAMAAKVGVKSVEILWTLGAYDLVLVGEAPDDETMTAYALSMASLGNVRTCTMRAYRAKEVAAILAKMA
ncbi:MAG TPA: GYD domain-containing protein [Anaeromyxobacteraceae bacterium]